MLRVKARRMGNDILVFSDGRVFKAKPEGWNQRGFVNSLKRTFTLKYEFYDDTDSMISRVEYDFFHNFFTIKREDNDAQIKIPLFFLKGQKYYVKEKLTKLLIWPVIDGRDIDIVFEATKSMKEYSIEFKGEDDNFEDILKEFSVGFMIRWMSFNIGI